MKKVLWILVCILFVGVLWGCGDTIPYVNSDNREKKTKENSEQEISSEGIKLKDKLTVTVVPPEKEKPAPLSGEEILSMSISEVTDYIKETALKNDSEELDVKIYSSDVWSKTILGQERMCRLGKDFGIFENYENGITLMRSLLYLFPEIQLRKMPNGMYYTAFASDAGDRVYYFASEENQLKTLVGYPVLVHGSLKKHEDFQGVTEGCTLDDVLEIDSTVKDFYDMFYQDGTPTENSLWASKTALRYTTVHYLSDGILEFGYGKISDDGKLVITEIRYSPNYTLKDCRGREIVYKINPLDLPR